MTIKKINASSEEAATPDTTQTDYVFRLYVSGATRASVLAVVNARKICEEHFKGRYQLEILNITENVGRAMQDQIIAIPTLVKVSPLPLRRFIGDISNSELVLASLGMSTPQLDGHST